MGVRNKVIRVAHEKGYRVSDCGTKVSYRGRFRKLQVMVNYGKPYYRFSVSMEGKSYNILVHRLQAYQMFKEDVFKDGIVVRHMDDASLNNCKTNLSLGTQAQNMKDKARNNLNR